MRALGAPLPARVVEFRVVAVCSRDSGEREERRAAGAEVGGRNPRGECASALGYGFGRCDGRDEGQGGRDAALKAWLLVPVPGVRALVGLQSGRGVSVPRRSGGVCGVSFVVLVSVENEMPFGMMAPCMPVVRGVPLGVNVRVLAAAVLVVEEPGARRRRAEGEQRRNGRRESQIETLHPRSGA